jgi:N-acetyl-anhydromuramyl-L-alanine amidase AmpD
MSATAQLGQSPPSNSVQGAPAGSPDDGSAGSEVFVSYLHRRGKKPQPTLPSVKPVVPPLQVDLAGVRNVAVTLRLKVRNRLLPKATVENRNKKTGKLTYRHIKEDVVPGATVELVTTVYPLAGRPRLTPEVARPAPQLDSLNLSSLRAKAVTDHGGHATLPLPPQGTYVVRVTARDTSTAEVGPSFVPPAHAERVFRPVEIEVTMSGGVPTQARVALRYQNWGSVDMADGQLVVGLQPVWIELKKADGTKITGRRKATELIVLHRSGDLTAMESVSTWLHGGFGPHYFIDKDGQVVKIMNDDASGRHAKDCIWQEHSVNSCSLGIEIINHDEDYTPAQYESVLRLVRAIRGRYPTIPPCNVVGHSDTAPHASATFKAHGHDHYKSQRNEDPGRQFDWPTLEHNWLGLCPLMLGGGTDWSEAYGGFFRVNLGGCLRQGDSDKARRFGGKDYATKAAQGRTGHPLPGPGVAGNPIAELQKDLRTIGYAVPKVTGEYDMETEHWVLVFQRHFNTTNRGGFARDGTLDRRTADLIKQVADYMVPRRLKRLVDGGVPVLGWVGLLDD